MEDREGIIYMLKGGVGCCEMMSFMRDVVISLSLQLALNTWTCAVCLICYMLINVLA